LNDAFPAGFAAAMKPVGRGECAAQGGENAGPVSSISRRKEDTAFHGDSRPTRGSSPSQPLLCKQRLTDIETTC
jgi:hypothetical protein